MNNKEHLQENFNSYDKENAETFVAAIRQLAGCEANLDNLESYLSQHFSTWMEKFANTPENLALELKSFAEMEI